jgi:hypothetical protein
VDRCNSSSSSSASRLAFRQCCCPAPTVATLQPVLVRQQLYSTLAEEEDNPVESATPNRLSTNPSTTTSSTIKVGDATLFFFSFFFCGFFYYFCVCDESIISRIFLFFFIPHVHFGPGQQFVTLMLPRNDKDDGPSADARKSK